MGIEQKPHPRFQRKDDDLFYHAEIDLLTALGGGTLNIEHLDDRWLSVTIAPGEVITPGAIKVIKGQGMPSFRHHDHGNLYIQFDVKFPEKDQLQNLHLLDQVLPPRMEQTHAPADAMVEDFEPEDIDSSEYSQSLAYGAAGGMDEADDDV